MNDPVARRGTEIKLRLDEDELLRELNLIKFRLHSPTNRITLQLHDCFARHFHLRVATTHFYRGGVSGSRDADHLQTCQVLIAKIKLIRKSLPSRDGKLIIVSRSDTPIDLHLKMIFSSLEISSPPTLVFVSCIVTSTNNFTSRQQPVIR